MIGPSDPEGLVGMRVTTAEKISEFFKQFQAPTGCWS